MTMTYEQQEALVRVIKRQGSDSLEKICSSGNLVMVVFKHITIAITPEGESHS